MYDLKLSELLGYIFGGEVAKEKLDYEGDSLRFVLGPLLTKSEEWAYEEEVRCVFSNKHRDERIFSYYKRLLLKMPPIKRIIVGCKADRDFIKDIKEVSGSIPISQMKIVDGEYKLVEAPLNKTT